MTIKRVKKQRKPKALKLKLGLPKVLTIEHEETGDIAGYPISHLSASSMVKFSTNPLLWKIQYINGDRFDTTMYVSGVIGRAFHYAMEIYYGGGEVKPVNEEEAIKMALSSGMDFLEKYPDGFTRYSTTVPNKQKALDMLSFAINEYIKYSPYKPSNVVAVEDMIEQKINLDWRGKNLVLPVKLKGYIDRVDLVDGQYKIYDYKTCTNFSNPEKIDGAKIIQAVQYYLLAYAKYGHEPYSLIFQEVKLTKNRDLSPQVREYEIVFKDNQLFFEFYFRLYEDIIRAINGEQVYVPNINAMFDNEVAIVAYIHRLDIEAEKAELMKKHNVKNLTDLLKSELQAASNMNRLMKTVSKEFVSAKNLNYESMKNEEKIKTKLMEHGLMVQFESLVEGATVDLYRYIPSIGLKMSRLKSYAEDIEQVLGISGIRILAPIPNSTLIGFEVPRVERSFPGVPSGNGFDIAIGQDIMGADRRFDLREAPHILVAGSSGSGKSVFLNSVIEQLSRISSVDLYLFDPKRVELMHHKKRAEVYRSDPEEIDLELEMLEKLMLDRYQEMERAGVRNIDGIADMRYKFVIIDEFGELIAAKHEKVNSVKTGKVFQRGQNKGMEEVKSETINLSDSIENRILRLAQMARAAGIHLIIATQRPSTDVIKGTIKANFPTKVVFKVSKAIDSMVVIDDVGAEKLSGKGDMLFSTGSSVERLQGYLA